jgi:hypothetical protein
LPGSCSGGGKVDRRLSIVDLPVLCYDEIGREYFHRLLRAVGGVIVFQISVSVNIGLEGSINVWQPYVEIGSEIIVKLLKAQFTIHRN